jgi:hypothetical protein
MDREVTSALSPEHPEKIRSNENAERSDQSTGNGNGHVRVRGPLPATRLTPAYARELARFAYVWAWPMVNLHNRYLKVRYAPQHGLLAGVLPLSPLNQLGMLTDYIDPREDFVACPNRDTVCGFGILSLGREPVVLQVPDFGERFWVYVVGDQRTDGFASMGAMYGTQPGFYLVVGPAWKGAVPEGITAVFRSPTNLGYVVPRVFQDDHPADKEAVRALISRVMAYPLSQFTGVMKSKNWAELPYLFSPMKALGERETQWVLPETFFATLPEVLDEVPPLSGEEAIYEQVRSLLQAVRGNPKLQRALQQAARDADRDLIEPLFEFRHHGVLLPHHWTTVNNGAAFGTDYFTRAAVAKSNIFIEKANETAYFYQDLDAGGRRLVGTRRYTITFAKDAMPPVRGFWSLTLYDEHHFFSRNEVSRFSLGSRNKHLNYNPDGSLTFYIQADRPPGDRRSNWLPTPSAGEFSLSMRAYWPEAAIIRGEWTPPPVRRAI